jgi:hypothetical protein
MMDRILRKMELAALSFGGTKHGPAGNAQARVMVPATVLAARRRFTVFLENWHTSD